MKKVILFILFALNSIAQVKNEEIKIQIVKSKLVDNVSVFGIRQLKITNDELTKVMNKTKISSTPNNKA